MSKKQQEQHIPLHMSETINEVPMHNQAHADMQRYALYVTRHRVTADFRDGLIPVQRRIIYTMFEKAGLKRKGPRVKSQAIVGLAMQHFHPHGDAAAYGAIKPLVNWFEIKMPLIDKKGNFGNLQGDSASASRYTEIGLTEFAIDVVFGDLAETNQSTDWIKNYNDTELEPEFLPVKVPLLLVNGAFNIGVGLKLEIPRHNLGEVIDATLALMDDPNADFVLIPDMCMPCEIINTDWKKINNGQSATFTVRSKIDIAELPNGNKELIMRSIPDLTYLESITDAIDELMQKNELPQIARLEDRSTDDYCELHIKLKKGADPIYVRDTIWKRTRAMQSCRVNLEALVDGVPMAMTYREYLLAFIEQRKLTKFRLYSNKLQDYDTKLHEKDAFIKVLSSGEIDKIIKMIRERKSTDENELIEYLVKKYKITDMQASYIINARLKNLEMAYLPKYKEEAKQLEQLKNDAYNKIVHDELIVKEIKEELISIKRKYATPRICTIVDDSVNDIPSGMFKIIITNNNFVRKIPDNEPVKNFKNDNVKTVIVGDNRESILIFDNMGKVFKLPIYKIPMTDRSGTDIRFLIKGLTSDICSIVYEKDLIAYNEKQTKYFLVVITAQGNIKKMDLADFTTVPPSGILYSKLDVGDVIQNIMIINDHFDILVCAGKSAIRIPMNEVAHLKRNTKGSRAMTTNHPISSISVIKPGSEYITVITKNGYVNKVNAIALPAKSRGKSGNQIIKLSKNDSIIAAMGVTDKTQIGILTQNGANLTIDMSTIPLGSTVSEGTRIVSRSDIILGYWIINAG